jgi:hypothetical protein
LTPRLGKGRVVAALCVGTTLLLTAGCTGTDGDGAHGAPAPMTDFQRLQLAVAKDIVQLVDHAGLVANPFSPAALPLDLYGTALLVQTQADLGMTPREVLPENLTDAEVEEYRSTSGIPESWLAFALSTIGAPGLSVTPSDPIAAPDPDVNEQAAQLWLRTMSEPAASRSEIEGALVSLVGDARLDAVALDRILDSCARVSLDCPERTMPVKGSLGLGDIEQMLQTRATLDLLERGVAVTGVDDLDRVELADAAERTISTAVGGYEAEVSALAEIAFAADGRTAAFEEYLRESESRRDPVTGVYRMHAEPLGTIANTFDATLAVGPYCGEFLAEHPLLEAVERDLAERGDDGDHVADVRAVYLKRLFEDISPADRARLDSAVASCEDPATGAPARVALAQLLPLVERTSCRPEIDPSLFDSAPETQRIDLLAAAQGGVLANSADVLIHFDDYLTSLPMTALSSDVDDPALLDRLTVLANDPELISGAQWEEVAVLVGRRGGCPGMPHLIRVTADPHGTCDVGLTRVALSIGVDYSEDRND